MATKAKTETKKGAKKEIAHGGIEIKIVGGIGFAKIEGNKVGLVKCFISLLKTLKEDPELAILFKIALDHSTCDNCKCKTEKEEKNKKEGKK